MFHSALFFLLFTFLSVLHSSSYFYTHFSYLCCCFLSPLLFFVDVQASCGCLVNVVEEEKLMKHLPIFWNPKKIIFQYMNEHTKNYWNLLVKNDKNRNEIFVTWSIDKIFLSFFIYKYIMLKCLWWRWQIKDMNIHRKTVGWNCWDYYSSVDLIQRRSPLNYDSSENLLLLPPLYIEIQVKYLLCWFLPLFSDFQSQSPVSTHRKL